MLLTGWLFIVPGGFKQEYVSADVLLSGVLI